jgi:hypothetical protein
LARGLHGLLGRLASARRGVKEVMMELTMRPTKANKTFVRVFVRAQDGNEVFPGFQDFKRLPARHLRRNTPVRTDEDRCVVVVNGAPRGGVVRFGAPRGALGRFEGVAESCPTLGRFLVFQSAICNAQYAIRLPIGPISFMMAVDTRRLRQYN